MGAADVDPRLLGRASVSNRTTAANWVHYTAHRARVAELILRLAPNGTGTDPASGGRVLAVLGAGNSNDLDLVRLVEVFDRLHLVDIDAAALRGGVDGQAEGSAEVYLHGGVDVTGAAEVRRAVAEQCDVVVSTGLLSQLVEDALDVAGPVTVLGVDQITALRATHLRLMVSLCRPGGRGLLVNDLVSSRTVPGLGEVASSQLPDLMEQLVRDGNFFTGSNPYAICGQLVDDRHLAAGAGEVSLHKPWIWRMSAQTCRLVYAVTFRRRGVEDGT